MAVFRYKFERILKVKEKDEDQCKLKLGEAMRNRDETETTLQLYKDQKTAIELRFKEEMAGSIAPQWLKHYNVAIEEQKKVIYQQELLLKRKNEIVEEQRQVLIEAVKQKKIYENLKEKAFTQYLAEEENANHIQLDELVSYKYNVGQND